MVTYHYPASKTERGIHMSPDDKNVSILDEREKRLMTTMLKQTIPQKFFQPSIKILDVGAGTGKLIKTLSIEGKYTLVEPDPKRADLAKKRVCLTKDQVIVDFFQNISLPSETFDLIFCIHLAQHVSEDDWEKIIKNISKIIKPGGYLVLAFTVKNSLFGTYNLQWTNKNDRTMNKVSRSEFNHIAKKHNPNILPIKKIDIDEMINQLSNLSFKVLRYEYYSPIFITRKQKTLQWFLKRLTSDLQNKILKIVRYRYYYDCIMIVRKKS